MELQNESVYDEYYEYDYEENQTSIMCDYSEWEPSYIIIPVLYMLIFIMGLCGNGVVIFTVRRAQGKRRNVDIYIANLALADLTFVLTLPLWAVHTAMHYHWPFGMAMCKISAYVVMLNKYASIFCLTCMSFDRYLAIVHSCTQLGTRGHTKASLIAMWLLSALLATPTLFFRSTIHNETSNRTACAVDLSLVATGKDAEDLWLAGLSLYTSVLAFLLPFLAMTACYCSIGCTVARHFDSLRKEDQRKRRLMKIILTLVVVFAACWTPFHVVKSADALSYLNLGPGTCSYLRFLLLAYPYAVCLAYVNSCLNPFLYAFFDQRFRSQCLGLLLKKPCHHRCPPKRQEAQSPDTPHACHGTGD